ncbi:DUF3592 domain-containing protein [Breznakiellaceae bacterium SP9]
MFGFVFFVFAVVAGFGCFHFVRQGAKMKTYITTERTAKMTSYTRSSTSRVGSDRCRTTTTYTYYKPILEYSYTVGKRKYTSTSVIFGGGRYASTDSGKIERVIDHPVGGSITVFYNPDKPDESFLDKKASGYITNAVVCAILTICFGAIGIGAMVTDIMGRDVF